MLLSEEILLSCGGIGYTNAEYKYLAALNRVLLPKN
jgi:hypothetical protein